MALPFRLPTFIAPIAIWRFSRWGATVPPLVAPDVTAEANLTPGRRVTGTPTHFDTFLLVPASTDIRFSESGVFSSFPATDPDLVEVPVGSARYYTVVDVEISALGFANEHLVVSIQKISPWPTTPIPPPPGGDLLLEDGTALLLEDSSDYLLE